MCGTLYKLDQNKNERGITLFLRNDIPSKKLSKKNEYTKKRAASESVPNSLYFVANDSYTYLNKNEDIFLLGFLIQALFL